MMQDYWNDPPELGYDDTACANCGAQLPDDPAEDTPAWEGYCDAACQAGKPGIGGWTPDLDAYGHLTWTVGDEDWIACFDVDVSPCGRFYAYHVVVNCESGCWIDTLDEGRGPIGEVGNVRGLAGYWLDIYHESVADGDAGEYSPEDNQRAIEAWEAHIDGLAAK